MPQRITIDIQEPKPQAASPNGADDIAELPAPAEAQPPPDEIPPHVRNAIAAHKSGKPFQAAFIHPELAKDLHKFYGPTGHILIHSEDQHGPFGHTHNG